MKLTGNTIFITGGGSGIGRGLAEALYPLGNQVIISGRRTGALAETTQANPGMRSVELDIADPALNVLINNAGVMRIDDAASAVEEDMLVSTITTNLMGPIRMTAELIEHLKRQEAAAVINVSSVLGFVPMASAAVYSSTKAALHSYTQSLRYRLQGTAVTVREIAPPWVQTDLLDSREEPRAMPLGEFIGETVRMLGTDAEELVVERAAPLRSRTGPADAAFVTQFNDLLEGPH